MIPYVIHLRLLPRSEQQEVGNFAFMFFLYKDYLDTRSIFALWSHRILPCFTAKIHTKTVGNFSVADPLIIIT